MTALLDLRMLWVTGKGGVGKTSIAAALAKVAALSGRRTLVCEMDAKGALANALGEDELGFEPTEVSPNLFAMTMSTEDALREYLRLFVKIDLTRGLGYSDAYVHAVEATATPPGQARPPAVGRAVDTSESAEQDWS